MGFAVENDSSDHDIMRRRSASIALSTRASGPAGKWRWYVKTESQPMDVHHRIAGRKWRIVEAIGGEKGRTRHGLIRKYAGMHRASGIKDDFSARGSSVSPTAGCDFIKRRATARPRSSRRRARLRARRCWRRSGASRVWRKSGRR